MPGFESNSDIVYAGLAAQLDELRTNALPRILASTLQASNINRIHEDGKDLLGKTIGDYSTEPMYVNPNRSPKKFGTVGKFGDKKFSNGQDHRTRYFKDGYKGFKDEVGQPSDKVTLDLTGRLKVDLGIGFSGPHVVLGFLSPYGSDLHKALEEKYKTAIWGESLNDRRERQIITRDYVKEIVDKKVG